MHDSNQAEAEYRIFIDKLNSDPTNNPSPNPSKKDKAWGHFKHVLTLNFHQYLITRQITGIEYSASLKRENKRRYSKHLTHSPN